MLTSIFFVCPNCYNTKKFRIFTSNFQVVKQSPEMGIRIEESDTLPSLREGDNYVECQQCFTKLAYDMAIVVGRKYIQQTKRFQNKTSPSFICR